MNKKTWLVTGLLIVACVGVGLGYSVNPWGFLVGLVGFVGAAVVAGLGAK